MINVKLMKNDKCKMKNFYLTSLLSVSPASPHYWPAPENKSGTSRKL